MDATISRMIEVTNLGTNQFVNENMEPIIQIFREQTPTDLWDAIDEDGDSSRVVDNSDVWNEDVVGSGLIVYLYSGTRKWVKTSVSKIPFSFLRKSLLTADNEYLTHFFVVRGGQGYPLTDKEIKTISALLHNATKNSEVASFINYTTVGEDTAETHQMLSHVANDLVAVIEQAGKYDLSTKTLTEETVTERLGESGTETVLVKGLELTVRTKLVEDNDPTKGFGYISVKAAHNGRAVLSATANTGVEQEDSD